MTKDDLLKFFEMLEGPQKIEPQMLYLTPSGREILYRYYLKGIVDGDITKKKLKAAGITRCVTGGKQKEWLEKDGKRMTPFVVIYPEFQSNLP